MKAKWEGRKRREKHKVKGERKIQEGRQKGQKGERTKGNKKAKRKT